MSDDYSYIYVGFRTFYISETRSVLSSADEKWNFYANCDRKTESK